MPATVINRFAGGMPSSAREDKKALELALQLTMLTGFNPYNNGHQHGGGGGALAGSPYRGSADDRELRRSANMTECVPVPSSEHVAEIVGRQGCKIKALRAKTNTYIKTPVRGEDPVFVVTGRREDVACAKREILSAADHFSQIRATRRGGSGAGTGTAAAVSSGLGPAAAMGLTASTASTAGAVMTSSTGAYCCSNRAPAGALLNGTATASLAMCCSTCKQPPGHVTIFVRVPYHVVGLVVGPKGATIKRIQQSTQTYIVTPSRDKEPVFEVTGLAECVEKARLEIEKHIAARTGSGSGSSPSSSGSESGGSCSGGVADEDDFHCNGVESAYFDEPSPLEAAGLSYGARCDIGSGGDSCCATVAAAAAALEAFSFVAAVDPPPTAVMSDFSLSRLRSGSNSSGGGCGGSSHGFDRVLDGKALGKSVGCGLPAGVVGSPAGVVGSPAGVVGPPAGVVGLPAIVSAETTAASAACSGGGGDTSSGGSSCARLPYWSESVASGDAAVGASGVSVVTSLLPGPAAAVGAPLPGRPGTGGTASSRLPAATSGGNGQRDRRLAREMACGNGVSASASSAFPLLLRQQQQHSRCSSGRASPSCSSPLPAAVFASDLVARCSL